jgi:hypothetical protein
VAPDSIRAPLTRIDSDRGVRARLRCARAPPLHWYAHALITAGPVDDNGKGIRVHIGCRAGPESPRQVCGYGAGQQPPRLAPTRSWPTVEGAGDRAHACARGHGLRPTASEAAQTSSCLRVRAPPKRLSALCSISKSPGHRRTITSCRRRRAPHHTAAGCGALESLASGTTSMSAQPFSLQAP